VSAQPSFLRADDIHARIGSAWPSVLAQLGIDEGFLRPKKSGPCPACGGRDRYTFDNRGGRGDFICRGCGAGDGFELLKRVHGWSFADSRRRVIEVAGLIDTQPVIARRSPSNAFPEAIAPLPLVATPPAKVRGVARAACAVADCQDTIAYLTTRGLWPLPEGCALKAHPSLDYWHEGQRARYSGLVAEVRDIAGDPVTLHVTYLQDGRKIAAPDARKLLSPCTGRTGCAVRLLPLAGDTLGIAEGIETALSAAALDGVPVWAALNTSLLAKFVPPPGVALLRIYADADVPGLEAGGRLMERLQAFVRLELRLPTAPYKDFNDQLLGRGARPKDSP
jgi:putative DNA primase/helicase